MKQGVYKLLLAFLMIASLGSGCGDESDLGEIVIGNPQNINVADAPAGTVILAQYEDPSVLTGGLPSMRLKTMTESEFNITILTNPSLRMVGRVFLTAGSFIPANGVTFLKAQIKEFRELAGFNRPAGLRYEILNPSCSGNAITNVNSCNPTLPLPNVGFGVFHQALLAQNNFFGAAVFGIVPLFRFVGPSGKLEFSTDPNLLIQGFAFDISSTFIFRSTAADRAAGRI